MFLDQIGHHVPLPAVASWVRQKERHQSSINGLSALRQGFHRGMEKVIASFNLYKNKSFDLFILIFLANLLCRKWHILMAKNIHMRTGNVMILDYFKNFIFTNSVLL